MEEHRSKAITPVLGRLGISPESVSGNDINITGVAFDSREVQPGFAFVCFSGLKVDGNEFIAEAIKRGASCIFSERQRASCPIPYFAVADVRVALAMLSDYFFDQPSLKLRPLGVTGTNGKTTTTHLIEHILNYAGRKTGLIGTLGARWPGANIYQNIKHTTPQSSDLHRTLADMVAAGCSHVSMEVSSHALAQKRVDGCHFASACLTNITQDHLDFHQTMENYWQSKRLLFEELNNSSHSNKSAVVNLDEPLSSEFLKVVGKSVSSLTYSYNQKADLSVQSASFDFNGTSLILNTPSGFLGLKSRLTGRFNVYNMMAALLVCFAEGIPFSTGCESLEDFPGVSGRFELVSWSPGNEPLCIVDYAHTPDGLDNVLKTARQLVSPPGRLIVVFGCGGDRDSSKRPQMGEIAESMCDQVIVTSDNPRSEDPQQIIANILAGIKRINRVKVEADRARAIRAAIAAASQKDVVVIAGKGHENYQILSDRTIPFDDRTEVKLALKERLPA